MPLRRPQSYRAKDGGIKVRRSIDLFFSFTLDTDTTDAVVRQTYDDFPGTQWSRKHHFTVVS